MTDEAYALEPRLRQVLEWVQAGAHADIGADHAYLPIHLLRSGRIRRGVVVEKNREPFEKARRNVEKAGLTGALEVRLGDGLSALGPGEVSSLSLCGMGAKLMVRILERGPDVLEGAEALVLQPNDSAEPLRRWARGAGFWLEREALVPGFWSYPVLRFVRAAGADPAYQGWPPQVPLEVLLAHGPHLLRRRDPLLLEGLERDSARLSALRGVSNPRTRGQLEQVHRALEWMRRVPR